MDISLSEDQQLLYQTALSFSHSAMTPARIREQIARVREEYGGFEIASLQVNSHTISYAKAAASMKLFSEQVLPHFA